MSVETRHQVLSPVQSLATHYIFAELEQAKAKASAMFGTVLKEAGLDRVDPGRVSVNLSGDAVQVSYETMVSDPPDGIVIPEAD